MHLTANSEAGAKRRDFGPAPSPVAFYLPGQAGNLFAMYYRPNEAAPEGCDVIYIHPFAGEMAASRNVIAAVSRHLASAGFGVLTLDLFGCGDSSGDFREARWEIWRADIAAAVRWLQEQGRDRVSLFGLRLGALLAMDFAAHSGERYEHIVLWQPVLNGQTMLTQFLRMNLDEMGDDPNGTQLTRPEYRRSLLPGQTIEVAGYELSSELIQAIDKQSLSPLGNALADPILWMEMGQKTGTSFRPDSLQIIQAWKSCGIRILIHELNGLPFWFFPHSVSPQRIAQQVTSLFTNIVQPSGV
jgi:exosortase A-associated hydrolase 2